MTRRKYKPMRARTYTLIDELLASGVKPLPLAKRTSHVERITESLASIERGEAPTTDDWRVCSDAVNYMETLVLEMRLAEDRDGLLLDAITALAAAGRRHAGGMPIRLDGPGIRAVRAVVEDYAAILDEVPERFVIRCHRLTEQRIRAIQRGKTRAHDVQVVGL